jgi:hypothetical protein
VTAISTVNIAPVSGETPFEVERARWLFTTWRSILAPSPPIELDVWRSFFDAWSRLDAPSAAIVGPPKLNSGEFYAFAAAFSEAFEASWRSGDMTNAWRASGLGRNELRNCEVLSWILDKYGDHGQGSALLEGLMESVGGPVTAKRVRENKYWTRVESLPFGDSESRIDIEIESPAFLIFIEAKIGAAEYGDQLPRYLDLASKKAAGRPWRVLFLTVDGRPPRDVGHHESIASISWKEVASVLDQSARRQTPSGLPKLLIRQFCEHIQHFA